MPSTSGREEFCNEIGAAIGDVMSTAPTVEVDLLLGNANSTLDTYGLGHDLFDRSVQCAWYDAENRGYAGLYVATGSDDASLVEHLPECQPGRVDAVDHIDLNLFPSRGVDDLEIDQLYEVPATFCGGFDADDALIPNCEPGGDPPKGGPCFITESNRLVMVKFLGSGDWRTDDPSDAEAVSFTRDLLAAAVATAGEVPFPVDAQAVVFGPRGPDGEPHRPAAPPPGDGPVDADEMPLTGDLRTELNEALAAWGARDTTLGGRAAPDGEVTSLHDWGEIEASLLWSDACLVGSSGSGACPFVAETLSGAPVPVEGLISYVELSDGRVEVVTLTWDGPPT